MLGVRIGKDDTNLFAASLSELAVKSGDRWIVPQPIKDPNGNVTGTNLQDVTCLTLPCDPRVYRFPVTTVSPGQLILTEESPDCETE
jgi:hypothetical protein